MLLSPSDTKVRLITSEGRWTIDFKEFTARTSTSCLVLHITLSILKILQNFNVKFYAVKYVEKLNYCRKKCKKEKNSALRYAEWSENSTEKMEYRKKFLKRKRLTPPEGTKKISTEREKQEFKNTVRAPLDCGTQVLASANFEGVPRCALCRPCGHGQDLGASGLAAPLAKIDGRHHPIREDLSDMSDDEVRQSGKCWVTAPFGNSIKEVGACNYWLSNWSTRVKWIYSH